MPTLHAAAPRRRQKQVRSLDTKDVTEVGLKPDMRGLAEGLRECVRIVGAEHVVASPEALDLASTATFATQSRVHAILRPANRDEVRACVRVANRFRLAIYPISSGKNWGYGSRVPPRDG